VIGIGAVIALVSLGQATQASVQNSIPGLRSKFSNRLSGSQQTAGGVQGGFGSSQTLTLDDATAITAAKFASISQVSPEVSRRGQVTAGRNNYQYLNYRRNTGLYGGSQCNYEFRNIYNRPRRQ